MINFIAGGKMGDFIHSLFVVKNICQQQNQQAHIYLSNQGDAWRFGLQKAYDDLKDFVMSQSYIDKFEILSKPLQDTFIDLNSWRANLGNINPTIGSYTKCWSDVLSQHYHFPISKEQYQWLHAYPNRLSHNKIVISRTHYRHNSAFPWPQIMNNPPCSAIFLASNMVEWNKFPYKSPHITLHQATSISEMASIIGSCKMFIGNQSAPFAIASALDIPRLVELELDPAMFYMGETKYSNNISWFLNDQMKHNSPNSIVQV